MEKILSILLEFEGIIGAVLGSVATLITTEMLKNRGRIKLYLKEVESKYFTYTEAGVWSPEKVNNKLHHYQLEYSFQVYNGTNLLRIMKDFEVIFYKNRQVIYRDIPKNEATKKIQNHRTYIDEMKIFNIYPKEIQLLDHSLYISEDKLNEIEGATEIKLIYFDEKDKKKSLTLSTDTIISK